MGPIQLFDLASRQAEWLSVRQGVVAGNIANVNTPDYKAKDITPFNSVLETTRPRMAVTHPAHFSQGSEMSQEVVESDLSKEIGVQESGNTVGLAGELMKSGEVKRQFELNTTLVKSFHKMMMSTVGK